MIVESVGDIIKLSGEITSNQWETIRTAAALILKRHPRGVVVDASGLTSCNEEGAQTFYDMMLYIERKRSRIIVANLPPPIKAALAHVPEVRSRLGVANSVDDAQHSLDLLDSGQAKTTNRHHSTGILILALCGGPADSYATALAASIAQLRHLKVFAVFPVVVPQALPTTTAMPEQEHLAESTLQSAKEYLSSKGIPVEMHAERTRSITAAIQKTASEIDERTAVVSLPPANVNTREPERTSEELLSKLDAEVILVREPRRK